MRNINLLPKKDLAQQYIIVLVCCICMAFIFMFVAQYMFKSKVATDMDKLNADVRFTETQIESQRQKFVMDERTTRYHQIAGMVDQIESAKKDWLTDLVYILGHSPKETLIKRISVDNNALLSTEIHFFSLSDLLQFIEKLQEEPQFRSLKVNEFSKVTPELRKDELAPEVEQEEEQSTLEDFIQSLLLGKDYEHTGTELEQLLRAQETKSEPTEESISPFLTENSPFSTDEIKDFIVKQLETTVIEEITDIENDEVSGIKQVEFEEYYRLAVEIQLDPSRKAEE